MNRVDSKKTYEERSDILERVMEAVYALSYEEAVELGLKLDAFDAMMDAIREQMCQFVDSGEFDNIENDDDATEAVRLILEE